MKTSKPRYVIGIDYSMTCPAGVCVLLEDPSNFEATELIYVMDSKKLSPLSNITAVTYPVTSSQEERFDALAKTFIKWIAAKTGGDVEVWIEDYAFAAKGKIFHIGENTGLLKHELWMNGFQFHVVPPTVIKKFATDKGNAEKTGMYDAFTGRIGVDLKTVYGSKMKGVGSPFGDLADAYFIAHYGVKKINA